MIKKLFVLVIVATVYFLPIYILGVYHLVVAAIFWSCPVGVFAAGAVGEFLYEH